MEEYFSRAQEMVDDIAIKMEGIAHLLYHYDKHSEGPRDREAMVGIAMILEDLAKQGRDLSGMLDCVNINEAQREKEAI